MIYRQIVGATSYVFADLRELLAKATPPRSGDRLAGVVAESAEQMIAARMALADVPLKQFLNEAVIPYEDDEVTRLILDTHAAQAFAPISALTVGGFRDWLLSDAATSETLNKVSRGITPEMAAGVSKLMREPCFFPLKAPRARRFTSPNFSTWSVTVVISRPPFCNVSPT